MNEAGFNMVRLAEFAWSKLEPREGVYEFEWLDEAIELLAKKGIKAIIGTPTAAPPPWVISAHPDILRVDGYGRRMAEGIRRNYCANNPYYNDRTKRIVQRMVLHYSGNPNVVGWQIDNEFGGDICYCNNCIEAFRAWLKEKYTALNRLNEACGLIFWGQEYHEWEEIYPPRLPLMMQSPGLNLEWRRFTCDSWVKYQQMQIDIIRQHAPHHLVTHNFMGMYKEQDYLELAKPLDFVSFDYYPKRSGSIDFAALAMSHDVMRSLKGKPYWIMELQSGTTKHPQAPIPEPGQIRLWTIQSVARGADGIIYFRWRTCRFGSEEYWHGILDHDGVPRRRYNEVKKVSAELKKIAPYIEGTAVKPDIAITLSYDNLWAWDLETCRNDQGYYGLPSWRPTLDWYEALYARNLPVDFVHPSFENLKQYKILFVPSLMLTGKDVEENLRQYVKDGGTLVASPRTGAKDVNNNIVDHPLPGGLYDIFGMTIEEYTGMPDGQKMKLASIKKMVDKQGTYECQIWAELLAPSKAWVAAYYQTGIYEGQPAVTINKFGGGNAIYVGTFANNRFYLDLVNWLIRKAKVKPPLPAVKGLEATERKSDNHRIVFALNHTADAINVPCGKRKFRDLVSGDEVTESVALGRYDVRILERLK
jgi:beta-galactosidase